MGSGDLALGLKVNMKIGDRELTVYYTENLIDEVKTRCEICKRIGQVFWYQIKIVGIEENGIEIKNRKLLKEAKETVVNRGQCGAKLCSRHHRDEIPNSL